MSNEDFESVNTFILFINEMAYDLGDEVLLGVLTVTLPAKKHLKDRQKLYDTAVAVNIYWRHKMGDYYDENNEMDNFIGLE